MEAAICRPASERTGASRQPRRLASPTRGSIDRCLRYRARTCAGHPVAADRSGSARNRSLPVSDGPNRWTHASTEGGSTRRRCFLSGTSVLLDHPVADVDRAGSLEHAHQLELRLSRLEAVEEPLPRAEDHRGHLEVDLVDQPGLEGLLGA